MYKSRNDIVTCILGLLHPHPFLTTVPNFKQNFIYFTQLPIQDQKNCLFDSVLFFYPNKPPHYNGSSLRLQLINQMAQYPLQYRVNQINKFNNSLIKESLNDNQVTE